MPRLELYPLSAIASGVTGKWVKAHYVAERQEIAERYTEWEIIGPPEIRDVNLHARSFSPWKVVPHAEVMRMSESPSNCSRTSKDSPAIDASKRSSSTCSFADTSRPFQRVASRDIK